MGFCCREIQLNRKRLYCPAEWKLVFIPPKRNNLKAKRVEQMWFKKKEETFFKMFNISFCLLHQSPGYGHTTPLSDTGKAFSILYALIGVPFTMLVLTACVQRLMYPLVLAPVSLLHRSGMEPRPATIVHFVLLVVLVLLLFFVAPAAVFSAVEMSWSFLDGIYFCFISLCTIGLGDFVPGTQPGQTYRALYQVAVMGECGCLLRSSSFLYTYLQKTAVTFSDHVVVLCLLEPLLLCLSLSCHICLLILAFEYVNSLTVTVLGSHTSSFFKARSSAVCVC